MDLVDKHLIAATIKRRLKLKSFALRGPHLLGFGSFWTATLCIVKNIILLKLMQVFNENRNLINELTSRAISHQIWVGNLVNPKRDAVQKNRGHFFLF